MEKTTEELNDLYTSPNIFWVIKSRRMRWTGHVAHIGEMIDVWRVWWGNMRERDHMGDPDVHGRIILRWIFRRWDVSYRLNRAGSGQGQLAGTCNALTNLCVL